MSIFIPLKIAKRKRYKNADEGVVLAAIQIAVDSDLSTEQRCLRVQHTYSPGTLGERSRNSKFSTHHQDQSMEILATREGEDEHLHTFEDR